ncbi:hypothetical protein CD178_02999 (plasmid) [Komagataeibacter saccharivorans]|uniref:Uncharacterized protein n=1 Tax=Komagataeibacter saccharivorans TaxID=265959 RepID=A0A347WFV0_9PROT|nr:hypothetical protein CD178_02999 [Komagataeibacter saccharivorans]
MFLFQQDTRSRARGQNGAQVFRRDRLDTGCCGNFQGTQDRIGCARKYPHNGIKQFQRRRREPAHRQRDLVRRVHGYALGQQVGKQDEHARYQHEAERRGQRLRRCDAQAPVDQILVQRRGDHAGTDDTAQNPDRVKTYLQDGNDLPAVAPQFQERDRPFITRFRAGLEPHIAGCGKRDFGKRNKNIKRDQHNKRYQPRQKQNHTAPMEEYLIHHIMNWRLPNRIKVFGPGIFC